MRISRFLVTVAALGLVAGCGSDTSDSKVAESTAASAAEETTEVDDALGEPVTSDSPADGPEVAGTGYTFNVPEGWHDMTEWYAETTGNDADKFYREEVPATPDFAQNVSIMFAPVTEGEFESAEDALAEFEAQVPEVAKAGGVTTAESNGRVQVDGAPGVRISIDYETGAKGEQFYLYREDQVVIVTFGLAPGSTEQDADELVSSVLSTWEWDARE